MSGTCKHIAAVLYSLKSLLNILMDFDKDFKKELLSDLTKKYFQFMISVFCEAIKEIIIIVLKRLMYVYILFI